MRGIDKLIIGTQYYRAPSPPHEDWKKDIENIRKMGMNTVKLFPQWRWHERIKAKFVWDDLDELFSLCEKNGLFVHINIVLDVAPDWLFREGRGLKVDNKGRIMYPKADGARFIGGWEPCFDDPVVRKEAERFLKAIVNRYKDNRMLNVWDIWNEPRSRPLGDCACPESRKRYREWLKNGYHTIEELNNFYGKAWTSWHDINPPVSLGDYAEMYLWRQWAMHSVADRVSWACRMAKSVDKKHPVMTHVGGCSMTQDVLNDTCDDWLTSRGVDFYGSSLVVDGIPAAFLHRTMPGLHCDWLRSISPYFWINEFYPNNAGWMDDVSPEELRLRFWATISHGARGILFWQYRSERLGNESNGHGIVDINGNPNERTEEIIKILQAVKKDAAIINDLKVGPAEVALIYDQRSDLVSRIESAEEYSYSTEGEFPYHHNYKASLQGAYALFWENNIPVDFISIHEINKIHKYKFIYLPVPYIVDKSMAKELVRFVRRGGILISEASIGLRAENTWVNPVNAPGILKDLFGAVEKNRVVMGQSAKVSFPSHGVSVPVTRIKTCVQAKEDISYGFWNRKEIAATINRYGHGKAILLGFYLGASYVDTADKSLIKFVGFLMRKFGINPPVQMRGVKGIVRTRVLLKDDNEKLLFLFNYGDKDEKIHLSVPFVSHFTSLDRKVRLEKSKSGIRVFLRAKEVVLILGKATT